MNGDSQYLEPADTTDCPGRSGGSQPSFQIVPKRDAEAAGKDRPVLYLSVSALMPTEVLCKKGL